MTLLPVRPFRWSSKWKRDVVPVLDHPHIQEALAWFKRTRRSERGECFKGTRPFLPYQTAPGVLHRYRNDYTKYDLNAYRAYYQCHWIAPFAQAVGEVLYPSLIWRRIGGQLHTTVVGCDPNDATGLLLPFVGSVRIVSDINLESKTFTPDHSITFAMFYLYACHNKQRFPDIKSVFYGENVDVVDKYYRDGGEAEGWASEVCGALLNGTFALSESRICRECCCEETQPHFRWTDAVDRATMDLYHNIIIHDPFSSLWLKATRAGTPE